MANPDPLQVYNGPNIQASNFNNNGFANITMPNKCRGGNTVIVAFQYGLGATGAAGFSLSSDKGDVFIGVDGGHDSGNAQSCAAFYFVGITEGAQVLRLKNVTGGIVNFMDVKAVEVPDITAIDVTNSANGTSATPTGGNLAVTQSGDYIFQYVARTSSDQTTSYTAGKQANIGYRLLVTMLLEGTCVQGGVLNSASAINPTLTMGTSTTWVSVALAFKTGSAGTQLAPFNNPSGMYIRAVHHINYTGTFSSPLLIQLPTVGNLVVIMRSGGAGAAGAIVSITDSNGNQWAASRIVSNDGSDQYAFAKRFRGSDDLIITVVTSSSVSNHTYMIYDIQGADPEPFQVDGTATGNQTIAGDLPTVTITPTAPGLLLSEVSNAFGTKNGVSNTDMTFDAFWWDGEPIDGPTNGDENNGWAHGYVADLAARTPTYTKTAGSGAAGQWESFAAMFSAAPGPILMGQISL